MRARARSAATAVCKWVAKLILFSILRIVIGIAVLILFILAVQYCYRQATEAQTNQPSAYFDARTPPIPSQLQQGGLPPLRLPCQVLQLRRSGSEN